MPILQAGGLNLGSGWFPQIGPYGGQMYVTLFKSISSVMWD